MMSTAMLVAMPAQAQQAGDDHIIRYDQAFFDHYNPVTLSDMIRYIPGGVTILNELRRSERSGNRGFGSDGAQILLDGKRISSKSNGISEKLNRIQASNVERIELIRGTAEGLDIRSEGTLINVVLKAGSGNTSSTFVDAMLKYNKVQKFEPEATVVQSGTRGRLDYTVSLKLDTWNRTTNILEDRFSPDRILEENRDQIDQEDFRENSLSGDLKYDLPGGGLIRLNGLYRDERYVYDAFEDQFSAVTGDLLAQEAQVFISDEKGWELGGDYETSLGIFGELKALFVLSDNTDDLSLEQDEIIGDDTTRLFTLGGVSKEQEQIFRANITKNINKRHTIEYGAEGAFNSLDNVQAFNDDPAEMSEVAEDRYEIFLTHSYQFSDKLTIQSALNKEFSTITQQSFGVDNSRSFRYWKPRLEIRYDITKSDQIRLLAERTVSQLDLDDFIADRNIEDDTIDFGNPDLEPFKQWKLSLSYERRFAEDRGSFRVEAYYDRISDHIAQIAIDEDSSGTGNIGDARRYGVDVEANIHFDFIGLPDASLTANFEYQNTRVTDPFLGIRRAFNNVPARFFQLDYRHALTDLGLVYGVSMHKRSNMARTDITVQEIRSNLHHFTSIYAEYIFDNGTKIRAETRQLFQDKKRFDRTIYDGNIANGIVNRFEFRRSDVYPTFLVRVQTSF